MKKETAKEAKVVEEKSVSTKKILKLAWNIFFWACFACILFMWVSDYINTKNEKDPVFCFAKNEIQKENGSVEECIGAGYKVFKYHTVGYEDAREFGAFWISPRD